MSLEMNDSLDSIEKLISPQVNVAALMASSSNTLPRRKMSLDNRSLGSDTTAYMYKYGYEIAPDYHLSKSNTLPSSLASLGQSSTAPGTAESVSQSPTLQSSEASLLLPRDRPLSSKPQNMRVVSGAQFRLVHKGLPGKCCDQCDHWERTHRKDKETIRGLKLQVNRLEESFKDLKYARSVETVPTTSHPAKYQTPNPAVAKSEEKTIDDPEALRRLQLLDEELVKIKRLLACERSAGEALRQSMDEQRSAFSAESQRLGKEGDKLSSELSLLRLQNAKLRAEVDALFTKHNDSERELQFCQKRLNDALLRLQAAQERLKGHGEDNLDALRELQRVRAELEETQAEMRHLEHQLSTKALACVGAEEQAADLAEQLRALEKERDQLATELVDSQGALKAAHEGLAVAKKRCDVLEGTLKLTIQERDSAKQAMTEQASEISSARARCAHLESELHALQQRLNDTLRRMTLESVNTKKALEKAITASVRLCVVAPTVNVNVADHRNKFRSRLSEKTLRQFLETEVFDKYSFLFKQDVENASPSGEAMDSWLQRMLGQMQVTIEAHVNSAMDGSSL